MITPISRHELAELASKLADPELKSWCDGSGILDSGEIVYADTEMLSRCFASAGSFSQESKPKSKRKKESKREDIQRQRGPKLDPIADVGQGSQDERITRS